MPSKFQGIDPKRRDVLLIPPHELSMIVRGPNIRWDLGDLTDLCVSIAAQGQLEPGLLRKNAQGRAELIAGNRRLEAILLINADPSAWLDGQGRPLSEPLPYLARHVEVTEDEALELTAAENEKQPLSAIDKAFASRNLRTRGWDNKRIGKVLRIDATKVSHLVRLMELPNRALRLIHQGRATEAWGQQLLGLSSDQIEAAMDRIDAGEKPSVVLRDLRAAHRERGVRRPRTRSEIAEAWEALAAEDDPAVSNFAVEVQKFLAGEADAQPLAEIVRGFLREVAA